ncbi:GntR family transcriptional regulator [Caballeronia sp. GACF4]|uniref:GntR family transcriptional regulator n=1 Tax=Caballeronia sp. GACF4 TaxID=2921763 RepID=UPI002027C217|nr:GntR family transcriptional regulator [Caballeronia sp. GACF4]
MELTNDVSDNLRQIAPRRSEQVYAELKDQLLQAGIRPGERLYESSVAERFNASRTPVREALMQLEKEKLIERDGRAYVVRKMTEDDLTQLYEARLCIETQTIRSAIDKITPDDIDELKRHIELMWKAIETADVERFNKIDSQFHLHIAALSGNRVLYGMLVGVHEQVMMIRNIAVREILNLTSANEEHARIVDAIARKNVEAAVAELKAHLVLTNVVKLFEIKAQK